MSNFVPPLKINIESTARDDKKTEKEVTLRYFVYNIKKTFTEIDNILKSVILFSDRK